MMHMLVINTSPCPLYYFNAHKFVQTVLHCMLQSFSFPIFFPDLNDVQSITDPLSKVQAGLQSQSDQPVPLKAVHVRAKLLDLAAEVSLLYYYYHHHWYVSHHHYHGSE